MTDQKNIYFQTAVELQEKITTGVISSQELTKAYIERIKQYNSDLNALVAYNFQQSIDEAIKCDEELKEGKSRGPLHGLPITIKDSFATKDFITTNSVKSLEKFQPKTDALLVDALRKAGAIIIGKTNLPMMAMDLQCNSPVHGRTNNPWDRSRTSGGSSGGSACAVSAGLSTFDLGSDIGGSIRVPSSFCGVYGFKASENVLSTEGHMPGVPHKDFVSIRHLVSCGPIARSIDDLRLIFDVLQSYQGIDPLTYKAESYYRKKKIGELTIKWGTTIANLPVEKSITQSIKNVIKKLQIHSCHVEKLSDTSINWQELWKTWGQIVDAECNSQASSLARLMQWLATSNVRKELPTVEMTFPLTLKNYMRVLLHRDRLIKEYETYMEDCDVLILPVTSTTAISHITPNKIMGYTPIYNQEIDVDNTNLHYWKSLSYFTTPFNVLGVPVVTIPIGFSDEKLPIGVQIIGKRGKDNELLHYAKMIDSVISHLKNPVL